MRSNTKSLTFAGDKSWWTWITLSIQLLMTRMIIWIFRFLSNETARHCTSIGNLLVVGDDIAFGYGDSIFKCFHGMSSYLPHHLNKERKLKTNWKIYNFGYWATNSRDWLPSSKSGLFSRIKKLIGEERSRNIILLFIGGNDAHFKIPIQESISNIKCICRALSNSKVFISTLPTWGDEGLSPDVAKMRSDLNLRIKELVNSQEILDLSSGVDLDANNFEYRVLNLYIRDGMHFSPAGYRKISQDLAEILINPMVKTEFHYFRQKIKGL